MNRHRTLAARVARLQAAAGSGSGAWLVEVAPAVLRDPAALGAAVARQRQATGWTGLVVGTVARAPSLDAWALTYGPASGST